MPDGLRALVLLWVGGFALGIAVIGIRRGRSVGRGVFEVERAARPEMFRCVVGLQIGAGVVCLIRALLLALG